MFIYHYRLISLNILSYIIISVGNNTISKADTFTKTTRKSL